MNELLIDSLSLNSIGLVILGLALVVTHFWNKRKLSRDTDIVVIDGISESLLSRLFKVKFLLIGIGFILAGIFWGVQDYEQRVMDHNSQILRTTLSKCNRQIPRTTLKRKREYVKKMENELIMSILDKQNDESVKEWYVNNEGLNRLKETESIPICIQLYEIYYDICDERQLEKLEKSYGAFYEEYWGSLYDEKKQRNKVFWKCVHQLMDERGISQERAYIFAPVFVQEFMDGRRE